MVVDGVPSTVVAGTSESSLAHAVPSVARATTATAQETHFDRPERWGDVVVYTDRRSSMAVTYPRTVWARRGRTLALGERLGTV